MDEKNKAIRTYLIMMFSLCYGLGDIELITKTGTVFEILHVAFTVFPVTCGILTARITKVKDRYVNSLRVWKNMKWWLFSAFVPAVLIVLGALLYFLIFPDRYSGILSYGKFLGNDESMEVGNVFGFAAVCIIASAFIIPIQLLELGEEIGWRGFMLRWQVEKYGEKKAVLINGFEWGLVHLPLIYFGFNYSSSNFGDPWTNMLMMLVMCIVLGIIFSYVTIKTENCMYAAIMHGVVNTIGEVPVLLTHDLESGLLGPNPTGLIGISFLLVLSAVFFTKLKGKVGRD